MIGIDDYLNVFIKPSSIAPLVLKALEGLKHRDWHFSSVSKRFPLPYY